MTDGELLGRFLAQRDEAAFEALMRRHGPMVLAVCRRVLANADDAEDAFQATFLVLVRKAASIKDRELVGNWLYGAAYRAALESKAARRRSRERQVDTMPEPVAPASETWDDLRPLLDRELSRLPEKYRVPVVLCDLEGRTRREVARQLGVPEGTLSGRLTTAHRKLARRLMRHGVLLSAAGLVAWFSQSSLSASVPVPLAISTAKAVTAVAAGQATLAGIVSAKVAALTEGVVKTMLLTKLKSLTLVVLTVAAFGSGGTMLTCSAVAGEKAAGRVAAHRAVADKEGAPKPAEKNYGYLGVMLASEEGKNQVTVQDVFADSPAAKAGIEAGDVLLKIGDKEITEPDEAVKLIQATKPGDKVTIHFKHDGKEKKATVTLGKWPADVERPDKGKEDKEDKGDKGEKDRGYLGLIMSDEDGGVVIHDLAPDSPAVKAGLKPGDILVQVRDKPAKSTVEVIEGLSGLKTGDKVKLRIKRDGKEKDVTITAAKRPADFGKM
jgi:RNA polymerase sigma factor (sigma-70 family)